MKENVFGVASARVAAQFAVAREQRLYTVHFILYTVYFIKQETAYQLAVRTGSARVRRAFEPSTSDDEVTCYLYFVLFYYYFTCTSSVRALHLGRRGGTPARLLNFILYTVNFALYISDDEAPASLLYTLHFYFSGH